MRRLLTSIAILCIVGAACAQTLSIEKYRLPNGMTVILHEDHSQPIVAVNIWYKVGSKDEPDRRSGFAHLFEHLMFMGTKRVPTGNFDVLMETHGGNNNASTTEDRTNYYEVGPAGLLPTLLWLEADRMEGLAQEMDQKKLDLQREVVKNERRQGVENEPYGKAYDAIPGLMFPQFHPYSRSVIGSMEDLNNASVQDVKDFFGTYYVANNASLVVAGDFDPKATKELIASLFGTLPRGNDIVRRTAPPVNFAGVKRTTMVDKVQSARTIMVWHSPAAFKPGDIEMRLASDILTSGFTSRLYQGIVIERELATDISAYQTPLLLGSTFTIEATARDGAALDRLEAAIDNVLTKFRKEGPTQAELNRQLAQISFRDVNRLQSLESRADQLNEYEFYFGNPDSFQKERNLFLAATPASIKAAVQRTLDPNRRLILRVIPETQAPTTNPRDTQPSVTPAKAVAFPMPTEFKLSNGLTVYYWQRSDLPLMSLHLRMSRGAAQDSPSKSGLTYLMADLMDESAGDRDAAELSDALDILGAQLSVNAGQESTSVQLSSLADKFEAAAALMADVLLRPKLAQEDWARVKELHLASLNQENDNPSYVAQKVANREFFGSSHPYSRSAWGSIESVQTIELEEIRTAYRATVTPSGATIYASGSLPEARLRAILEDKLGGWKGQAAVDEPAYPRAEPGKQRLLIVDKAAAVQTVVQILMPTEDFGSERRHALTELGIAMGGTFTSRINRNLREDKGYTYGAGMSFEFSKPASYSVLSTSVRADVTGASLKEIIAEFQKVSEGNLSEQEANMAKNTILMEMASAVGTRAGLILTAAGFIQNGIPLSKIGTEMDQFAKVDLATLNEVAKSGIRFDRAVIVLVGDRAEITKQLSGLGLPEPEIVKP